MSSAITSDLGDDLEYQVTVKFTGIAPGTGPVDAFTLHGICSRVREAFYTDPAGLLDALSAVMEDDAFTVKVCPLAEDE